MIACKSVALKAESAEKGARLRIGDLKASEQVVGVTNMFEAGEIGLPAASSLSEGDKCSRLESWSLKSDIFRSG